MYGSVGMSDQEWSGRSNLVGITRAFNQNIFDMSKHRVAIEQLSGREALEKRSCVGRVEDRVDRKAFV